MKEGGGGGGGGGGVEVVWGWVWLVEEYIVYYVSRPYHLSCEFGADLDGRQAPPSLLSYVGQTLVQLGLESW